MVNNDISRLQRAVYRLTGCTSRYVETILVTECFHGFRGEALWQCEVAVFEIKGHPNAARVYTWVDKNREHASDTQVIVLEVPPVNSAHTAVAAAMAASILNGSFEIS